MPHVPWGTVFAAIAAVTGVISSWDKIMAWINGFRAKQADDERLWSLSMERDPEHKLRYRATLSYAAAGRVPIRLDRVSVAAPRGALLQQVEPGSNRTLTKAAVTTVVGRDLNARVIAGNQLHLRIILPPRSPWLWRDRRVRLVAHIEECSARRRAFRVKVKGEVLEA